MDIKGIMSRKNNKKEENGGIVYLDVSDFSKKLLVHGEYHKGKNRCYAKYKKARIIFLED